MFRKFIKNIIKKDFVKDVLTLFSGSLLGQSIIYLTIPFLTRLFSEEAFGVFILYSSVILISNTFITLRYELSTVLPKRDKDAVNLFVFNIIVVFSLSLIFFIVILIFYDGIVSLLRIEKIGYFVYFVPLSSFFVGCITAFNYWNNRVNLFKNISYGLVSKAVAMSTSQMITGVSSFSTIGLIPGLIFGQFINMLVIVKLTFKKVYGLRKFLTVRRMFYLASKYREIPLFNTILSFTNILSNELPVLLISRYFGLSAAGIYGLAVKVSKTPPGMIVQSLSQVFFNKAGKVYNSNGNLYKLIKKTYKNLFITSLIVFIPLFILSFFLDFIFGNAWVDAGLYVRLLLPWIYIGFFSAPISSLIVVLKKQRVVLLYDVLLLIFRFLAIFIGFKIYNDIVISLALFSIVGVIFNSFIILYFFKIAKMSITQEKNAYE